jgi:putative SOS response-associated peptidase YedK
VRWKLSRTVLRGGAGGNTGPLLDVRSGRSKQPFLFRLRDGSLFAFTALWEVGRDREGIEVEAFALLTTEANELVRPAHDRMPVILDPKDYGPWLDPSLTDPTLFGDWLRPYPADAMMAYPLSPHEGPDCAAPAQA